MNSTHDYAASIFGQGSRWCKACAPRGDSEDGCERPLARYAEWVVIRESDQQPQARLVSSTMSEAASRFAVA